jgi:hypothetical protein
LVARGVAKKSRKTKKVRKKILLFLTKIKYAMFSAKHVVLTRWRWTSASVYFLTIHHPTHTHVFRYMKGASQLVISSVNVTQMTSASLTSWNENISKHWVWKRKIFSWSWNTSVYSNGRPRSLVGLQQMIGERLPILTVGVAREVVILLSFSVNLSRKPEVTKTILMF